MFLGALFSVLCSSSCTPLPQHSSLSTMTFMQMALNSSSPFDSKNSPSKCCTADLFLDEWKDVPLQTIVNFNSSCNNACMKFKFLCNTTFGYFQSHPLLGRKLYDFDQVKEFCISQGSAVTTFRCGGQVHYHLCQIQDSMYQKLLKSVHFWLSYSTNNKGCSFIGPWSTTKKVNNVKRIHTQCLQIEHIFYASTHPIQPKLPESFQMPWNWFLPCDAMLAWYMLSSCVCVFVCHMLVLSTWLNVHRGP